MVPKVKVEAEAVELLLDEIEKIIEREGSSVEELMGHVQKEEDLRNMILKYAGVSDYGLILLSAVTLLRMLPSKGEVTQYTQKIQSLEEEVSSLEAENQQLGDQITQEQLKHSTFEDTMLSRIEDLFPDLWKYENLYEAVKHCTEQAWSR